MPDTIMPAFHSYPNEAAVIGRMLAGYGELEVDLCQCVGAVLGDLNTAIRILYRIRSEDSRLKIGDAVLRPAFASRDLADGYNEMLGAMRWCKRARNQYAHCQWLGEEEGLFFTTLDKTAKTSTAPMRVRFYHIDLPLLKEQEHYFRYTQRWAWYLTAEYQRDPERPISSQPFPIPRIIPQPNLCSPPGTYRPLRETTGV
jgi:hypothetical protein